MVAIVYTSDAIIESNEDEPTNADIEIGDRPLNESDFLNLMAKIDWPINGR